MDDFQKVYIGTREIVFTSREEGFPEAERLEVSPDEPLNLTKLLQKVQFTKRLAVITPALEEVFSNFCHNTPLVDAGGGLVRDPRGWVLMILRNGRWDLPKGKLEPGEAIEECALREVEEECSVSSLRSEGFLTNTYHAYKLEGEWVLKRTAWYRMSCPAGQQPRPQEVEGIAEALWVAPEELPGKLENTYQTILDVFRAEGAV